MAEITSKAAGPRLLNVKGDEGATQVTIMPGQTLDIELVNPEHAATKALFDRGDLVHGRPEDKAKADAAAKTAEFKAEYDRGFADGVKSAKKP